MTLVDWDESYSVGNGEIDDDHRRIITLLNEIHQAYETGQPAAEIAGLFDRLIEATVAHCRREESILTARDYVWLDAQRADHRLLIESLGTMRRSVEKPGTGERAAAEVGDFLLNWFMSHILEEDMQFRTIFRPAR